MTDATFRIKNLSIALEAVSHSPGNDSIRWGIEDLLKAEIQEAKEEKLKEKHPIQSTQPISNDDIPF